MPELLYTFQELNVLSNVSNVHRSTARFDGLDKTSAPGHRRHRDYRVCERRHTKETERETRGQEVRDRKEGGEREKGQEVRDREEGGGRAAREEGDRKGDRGGLGRGRGNAASKGSGQRRQTRQQVDKGEVEKTET